MREEGRVSMYHQVAVHDMGKEERAMMHTIPPHLPHNHKRDRSKRQP